MTTGPESGASNLTERVSNGMSKVEEYAALPLYATNERFQDRVDTAEGYISMASIKIARGDNIATEEYCIKGELQLAAAKSIIDSLTNPSTPRKVRRYRV